MTTEKHRQPGFEFTLDFEKMVNYDLRDPDRRGPYYERLRSPQNVLKWLHALIVIRDDIHFQQAQDTAMLKAHPHRGSGGPTHPDYLAAQKEVNAKRERRVNVERIVEQRILEAEGLIGTKPLETATVGKVLSRLIKIRVCIENEDTDSAQRQLDWMIDMLEQL